MSFRASLLLGVSCLALGCNASSPRAPETQGADASAAHTSAPAISWPNGARAAVSLTYDDALRSQLDHALPALQKHALRGTFFLTGTSKVLQASPESYRALVRAGHELGAHTMNHPCDRALSFVKPGMALQDYDFARMGAELAESVKQLHDLGQQGPLSFAYPCGSTWLGEPPRSYVPLIEKSFGAARGIFRGLVEPAHAPLYDVPSVMGDISGAALIDWVERALSSGDWLVFTFHGVAGDNLSVDEAAHEALLAYLDRNRAKIWTDRFGTVAQYVRDHAPAEPVAPATAASGK